MLQQIILPRFNNTLEEQLINFNKTGDDPACTPLTQTVPCLRSTIQLPFFGAMQLMLSATAIALLYLIMFRTKSKKK